MSSRSSTSSSGSESSDQAQNKKKYVLQEDSSESDAGTPSDSEDSSDVESKEDGPHGDGEEEEVPVLSHAEKRRQKKKEQNLSQANESKSDNTKPGKVKNTAELAPSKVPKRQNSVWVGNLSFKTTPEAIRNFFDGVGEITRIHMPMKLASSGPGGKGAMKENRGFAYVDFATPDAKLLAITLSENPLEGRRLLIKDGDDFTGRPSTSAPSTGDLSAADTQSKPSGLSKTAQKILRSQKQPPAPTLFFGNLGFETTTQTICDLLSAHRKKPVADEHAQDTPEDKPSTNDKWIRKVRMGTFEDSGKCKGWAFVDFTSIEHATEALTNPKNYFLNGRKLVVEYASPEAVRRGGGPRGIKGQKEKDTRQDGETGDDGRRRERVRPVRKRKDAEDDGEEGAGGESQHPTKRMRVEKPEHPRSRTEKGDDSRKSFKSRAKPGAALAMAKREAVSIVPSQGKKIVF